MPYFFMSDQLSSEGELFPKERNPYDMQQHVYITAHVTYKQGSLLRALVYAGAEIFPSQGLLIAALELSLGLCCPVLRCL